MAHFNVSGFYRRTLKLSKRTAEKSVTWTFKRVIISIPAHMRYLYNGTQRDKRKSTWLAVTYTTYLHADGTTRYTNGTTVSLDALLTLSTTQGNK